MKNIQVTIICKRKGQGLWYKYFRCVCVYCNYVDYVAWRGISHEHLESHKINYEKNKNLNPFDQNLIDSIVKEFQKKYVPKEKQPYYQHINKNKKK